MEDTHEKKKKKKERVIRKCNKWGGCDFGLDFIVVCGENEK